MASLAPNTALLKSPSNWFLVAFAMVLLTIIANLFFKDK